MTQTQTRIVEKLQALVCPPDGIASTGGEQKSTGNQYPNADNIDLNRHVCGQTTFAIDVTYTDTTGTEVCQVGVCDIDEPGEGGYAKAMTIRDHLATKGIRTLISFSGQKGWHVYVFAEPVPYQIMVATLKKVKAGIPFQGELIPGDCRRCKVAPCMHQVSGNMSYLVGEQPYQDTFGLEDLPDGFYEEQLAILEGITPTPANVLVAFATADQEPQRREISQDMVPKLNKDDDYIPPCIQKLVEKGGSPHLERYDRCNLTLRGFTDAKGLGEKESLELAREMAKNAENGPVLTTKNLKEKVRHFKSIKNPPCLNDNPFSCINMLRGRQYLKFDCGECQVRPDGVHVGQRSSDRQAEPPLTLVLERPVAREVMTYIIQKGKPVEPIAPEIMPANVFKSPLWKGPELAFKGYQLLLRAIDDGCVSLTQIAKWLDHGIRKIDDLAVYTEKSSVELSELLRTNNVAFAAFRTEFKDGILGLFEKLAGRAIVDDDTWQEMLERAADMTMRYRLAEKSIALHGGILDPAKDIYTTYSEYTDQSNQIFSGSQRGAVVPISARAGHLIDYLLGGGAAKTPTPFPELNSLLGGGLINGSLYVAVSPPGGGKTTFASQCADFAAQSGIPVIFVSMEMGIEQIFGNSMAREIPMNSAKIVSPHADIKDAVQNQVGEAAEAYFESIGKYLHIVEGTYDTTPGRIQAMINTVRAEHKITQRDPFLVVIDYLQLLNTGKEFLDTSPNETIKISELAVRCKQLARDCGVSVLAISDITKDEQQKSFASKEFTLNSLRGSNRIGHAADTVMALYSESSEADGGKAMDDPWDMYLKKVNSSERAQDFVESVNRAKKEYKTGGDGAAVYARLELIKNRAGQGRGSQFLLYHRAYHRFEPVILPGQAKAEGRA